MTYTVVELARQKVADPTGQGVRWLTRCKLARVDQQERTLNLYLTAEECHGWGLGDKVRVTFTRVSQEVTQ